MQANLTKLLQNSPCKNLTIEGINQELLILGERQGMDAMALYLLLRKKAKTQYARDFEIVALVKCGVLLLV